MAQAPGPSIGPSIGGLPTVEYRRRPRAGRGAPPRPGRPSEDSSLASTDRRPIPALGTKRFRMMSHRGASVPDLELPSLAISDRPSPPRPAGRPERRSAPEPDRQGRHVSEPKLLLICDHRGDDAAKRWLGAASGYRVVASQSLRESLRLLEEQVPALIVLDPLAPTRPVELEEQNRNRRRVVIHKKSWK